MVYFSFVWMDYCRIKARSTPQIKASGLSVVCIVGAVCMTDQSRRAGIAGDFGYSPPGMSIQTGHHAIISKIRVHCVRIRENRRSPMMMQTLLVVVALAVMSWPGAQSHAQSYPVKPVRYVVAFAAGDSPDIVARLVADRLSRLWDQQMVVENRVGAGGTIAGAAVANAQPDGYTLFHCNIASSAIAAVMYPKLPYDPLRDFAMVSRIATTANALIVHPSLPAKSVAEFIAYAKANPGKLSYGSPGVGTSPHLSMELFKSITGTNVVHVAYKGAMPALADVIGGQIPVMLANLPALLPHIVSGKTRALAVTSAKRTAQLPSVPTMVESGVSDYVVTSWYGMCAPAATPMPILEKLHADLMKTLQAPDVQQRLSDLVIDVAPTSRDEFTAFIRSEIARWAQVVKEAGIPLQ
jgi:tripartite-type tricarboxylate transporter receptor subunit TctC